MLELEAPPLAGEKKKKRERLRKGKWREFLMEKGTPPQEEDAPVECREPRLSLERKLLHGEGRGGEVWAREQVSKTQRYLAANSFALPESWQRVPYLLDNTQLELFPE